MKNKLVIPTLLVLATVVSVALWQHAQHREPITVGIICWYRSGAVVGSSELHAGTLFLEEHPDSLIKIEIVDGQWKPDKSVAAAERAIREGIRFFISCEPSKCAVANMHLFGGRPDPLLINTASTTPDLTGKDDHILRVVSDGEHEQRSIARYIHKLPGHHILVLQDEGNLPYTEPAFNFFSSELEALGKWRITHRKLMVADFRPKDLESLMAGDFDALFILAGSFQNAIGNIAQLFHSLHPKAPIVLTPWARSPSILDMAGPAVERIILPSQYPARHSDAAIEDFFRRFRTRFGYEPHAMTIGLWQGMKLLDQAFSNGFRTPEEVKDYLLSVPTHQTGLGPISFDQSGDVTRDFNFIEDVRKELK